MLDIMDSKHRNSACMMGIDEAGRGPVLGPMIYASAVAPIEMHEEIMTLGFADSKTLSEEQREKLLTVLLDRTNWIAGSIHVISPVFITEKMLDRYKTSLNTISHDAAIGLIQTALDAGVNLKEVYVDTVGKADHYQAKLQALFPKLKITVESKADDTYAIVSAASIFAKVTRDRLLQMWPSSERGSVPADLPIGSGYPGGKLQLTDITSNLTTLPSHACAILRDGYRKPPLLLDPVTKKYLEACMDPVFGFPSLVRSSWSTAFNLIEKAGVRIIWEDDEDAQKATEAKRLARKREFAKGTLKLSNFFSCDAAAKEDSSTQSIERRSYFTRCQMVHLD